MPDIFDILLDDDNDLLIEDGDFVIGESTKHHQKHLLLAQKGEYKQSPKVGIGISDFLEDDDFSGIDVEIQKQFELDGQKVNSIEVFNDGKVIIDAGY